MFKRKTWLLNINVEQTWNDFNIMPNVTDEVRNKLVEQQEQQLLLIADNKDEVIFRHPPNEDFLNYLQEQISLPKIVIKSSKYEVYDYLSCTKNLVIPYILTEEITQIINGDQLIYKDNKMIKNLNNKYFARKWAIENNFETTKGRFCNNQHEIRKYVLENFDKGFYSVLKLPYGSSGKGLKVITNEKELNLVVNYLSKRLKNNKGEILVERWHEYKYSLSAQLHLSNDEIEILKITQQLIDEKGKYLGTNFSPKLEQNIYDDYSRKLKVIGNLLSTNGYKGFIGVDSIVDKENKVIPIIEFNARLTQVTYLLRYVERLESNYTNIFSTFFEIHTNTNLTFEYIKNKISKTIKKFLIYSFCEINKNDLKIYRVFILVYNNEKQVLNDNIIDELKKIGEVK